MMLRDAVEKHYLKFLGKPSVLYSVKMDAHPSGHYQISEFRDIPHQGAVTLATQGFCEVPLHMFRQELMILCYHNFVSDDLIALLGVVAKIVANDNHPLLQGRVIGPYGPLLKSTSMEALYSTVPTYFVDDFQLVESGEVPVDIGWLIPIYKSEAEWVEQHGWKAFEGLLVEEDPDVMDLTRPPLV